MPAVHNPAMMNKRFLVLLLVLVVFLGYTVYVIVARDVSLFAYLGALRPNSWATQILIDLYIACALLSVWMIKDARARGRSVASVLPFLFLTLLLASMGPLLYLLFRERQMRHAASKGRAAPPS